ncbi:hypothetical protein JCM8097_001786 [Rhodosporidiobolus ruineniae]
MQHPARTGNPLVDKWLQSPLNRYFQLKGHRTDVVEFEEERGHLEEIRDDGEREEEARILLMEAAFKAVTVHPNAESLELLASYGWLRGQRDALTRLLVNWPLLLPFTAIETSWKGSRSGRNLVSAVARQSGGYHSPPNGPGPELDALTSYFKALAPAAFVLWRYLRLTYHHRLTDPNEQALLSQLEGKGWSRQSSPKLHRRTSEAPSFYPHLSNANPRQQQVSAPPLARRRTGPW